MQNNTFNPILDTDSYKASHFLQYPPSTTSLFAYLESRGGLFQQTLFFGLQAILKSQLIQPITAENISEAAEIFAQHGLPFAKAGFERIVNLHQGHWPVKIRAVPEGTLVPTHNVLMTVESTDPALPWVVTYLETMILRVWYPVTVATLSLNARKMIEKALIQSADDPASEIPFKLHDFGARGVSSRESAMLGGMAHLVNFQGTDTVAALIAAREFYGCPMAGYSIPAAEHSTMTSWGRNRETEAYQSMLDHFAEPGSIIAVVSDSYDIDHAIAHIWGQKLKSKVIESGATIVIRVDSGDPVEQVLGALNKLDHAFGHHLNSKGFKLLNHVRVIQGDGIDLNTIQEILDTVLNAGYSASNVVFGMGGALLQKVNRDTQKFAYKVCEATIDGKRIPIRKEPVSDKGKWSKAGRQDLIRNTNGEFQTITIPDSLDQSPDSVLQTVYIDGKLQNEATFDEIRKRANCHS